MDQLQSRLIQAGYKLTHPRLVVLQQMLACGTSFTANDLLECVSRTAPGVGRATLFRTLDLLVELGAVQRAHTEAGGDWGHRYMICDLVDSHHHHLVCTRCGQIADFEGCFFDYLMRELQTQVNFRVEGHNLEVYGECERCQGVSGGTNA